MRIEIKPLSVNEAFQGRRFKTPKYKAYERDVLLMLSPMIVPDGPLELSIVFGLSNKNADIDNPVKCFVDCLQKKYGFNDRMIYAMNITKTDVKKGREFIDFDIRAAAR